MHLVMRGRLERTFLLSYLAPAGALAGHLPPGLELLAVHGTGIVNVVVSRVSNLRPGGLPAFAGIGYWHVAYRLLVQARLASGQTLHGLYFLRSLLSRRALVPVANLLTELRARAARVEVQGGDDRLSMSIMDLGRPAEAAHLVLSKGARPPKMIGPDGLEPLLAYQPLGLAVDRDGRRLDILEVVREEARWRESPVGVIQNNWPYLQRLVPEGLRLVRATAVAPIEYAWKIGETRALAR